MILLLESLHAEAEALLAQAGDLVRAKDPNQPPADLSRVRAILTRGRGEIREALLARCPALKVVARAGAGLDNLDTAAATKRGIAVIFAPGANTNTVAEHTLGLMLDLARGISRDARSVAAGRWDDRTRYAGDELGGLTLGIVGFGSIGKRVAKLAEAFGMRVIVAAHKGNEGPSLRELLAASDIVSLHVPLTPAASEPLLALPNVLITPHVASLTAATYRTLCLSTATNVVHVLRGEPPEPRSVLR